MKHTTAPGFRHSSWMDLGMELGLVLLLSVIFVPYVWTTSVIEDELLTLSHGLRQIRGEVLYRDFFEFTAPLSHWLVAVLFKVTGPSFFAARVLLGVVLVLGGWLFYRIARALGAGPWSAAIPCLALFFGLFRIWPGFSHHWVALPFMALAILVTFRALTTGSLAWWGATGVVSGLTVLTMQSDGLVLLTALVGVLVLECGLGDRTPRQSLTFGGALLAGLLLPLGMAAAFFAWHGALAEAWYNVWTFPTTQYKSAGGINDFKFASDFPAVISPVNNFPWWYGRLYHFSFLFVIQPLMAVLSLAWGLDLIGRRIRQGRRWTLDEAKTALVGLLTIGFLVLSTRGRADYIHVALYAPVSILMAVVVAERWAVALPDHHLLLKKVPHLALVLFIATGASMFGKWASQAVSWRHLQVPDHVLAASPVIQYLNARTKPGDRVVAIPYGGFYYFYGPPPASRYSLMLASTHGYYSDTQVQEFRDELSRNRPKFIVINPWTTDEGQFKQFVELLPSGYRRVATVDSPQYGGSKAAIYAQ